MNPALPPTPTTATSMSLRDVWLHLRLPFSQYLLPVCLFALTLPPGIASPDWGRVVWILVVIHVLMYPAANTFNSYYDRDEGSVNGLEAPPPVDRTLFWVSMGLEALALVGGVLINWQFVFFILVYGAFMKAYSHTAIRIKKRPVASWLLISTFQGGFVFLMTYVIVHNINLATVFQPGTWPAGVALGTLISTLNILALYPVTQVYQHAEDASRGDLTISRLMGVRGTFVNAWVCLVAAAVCFFVFYSGGWPFWLMAALLAPGLIYLALITARVWQDPTTATYRAAMWMTRLTGWGMNLFFLILLAGQ
ncbi:chlorophyll synthase [Fibrella aestuarina BUZ 2]|uniref:Chlorophyll synthase n=1 Tax=Fibrella aestuarina BUZ 2 TaxID=1166018 RepID=I0KET8_9BACT|nr:UbiA family prenyltransferase [Fibrella aestuarina]CCH02641.1 chlorophyll synthase [Fibrella aestuarina BUZ 2]